MDYFAKGLEEARCILDSFVKEIEDYWVDNPIGSAKNVPFELNEVVDLRPNFFGIGLNLNALIKRILRRRQR